jgi:DNA-binding beta-propeller fold protein YncE
MGLSETMGDGRNRTLGVRLAWFCMLLFFLAGLELAGKPDMASAAEAPAALWSRCAANSEVDTACQIPRGIAADPNSGHVFVADQANRRVVEFSALGTFLGTWGWDVIANGPDDAGTGFEVCVRARGDICKAGVAGDGSGQLAAPLGVGVDSAGNVYVVDFPNNRVQEFDPDGHFLLMFGGEVNKTKVEAAAPEAEQNLCTAASGDACQAGVEGTGSGQFGSWAVGSFIAIDANGSETTADDIVYVGDKDRIQVFDTGGHYLKSLSLPGKTVQSLAVDTSGDLYAIYNGRVGVHKLSPTGEALSPTFELTQFGFNSPVPTAVAVDSSGHVYAFGPPVVESVLHPPIFEFEPDGSLIANFGEGEFNDSTGMATNLCPGDESPGNLYVTNASASKPLLRAYGAEPKNCGKAISLPATNVAKTSATLNGKANPKGLAVSECLFEYGTTLTYGQTAPCVPAAGELGSGTEPVPVHAGVSGLTKGTIYHFRLLVGTASGSEESSDETFKTLGPPVVSDEAAFNIAYTEATLKALVNPEGFPTRYRFIYGVEGGPEQSTPEIEVGAPGDRTDHAAVANLEGLTPGTAYHWRVVATNSSGTTEGEEHVLTTYLEPSLAPCPNDAFRTGPGAALPDCRAYEMVSPAGKNGGDILHGFEAYLQTSPDGDRFTYSAPPAFGDVQASVLQNQYLASRDPKAGWFNHGIHPAVAGEHSVSGIFFGQFREFEAFSPDLCDAWFLDVMSPTLTDEGQDDYENHYRLDLCGEEEPEALTSAKPPPGTDEAYVNLYGQSVAGVSDDSSHALFAARAALTPDAAATVNPQVYDRFEDGLHLVSILPNGNADPSGSGLGGGSRYNLENAASSDGSRVYWSSGLSEASGTASKIFLRENLGEEQSAVEGGKCTEPAKACTVLVVNGGIGGVFFWAAASDGSGAIFGKGENAEELTEFSLVRFEADPKTASRTIASHVKGVLGASDGLARIYFVSTDVLAPGQKNSEGDEAQAGKPNLYLDEEGTKTFIATLASGDVSVAGVGEGLVYSLTSRIPYWRATRVTPDGGQLTFQSRASLTGFDNADSGNGKADVEVFTYHAGGALHCVSCSAGGARPSGVELHEPYILPFNSGKNHVFAAAWIPTWEHPLYASHVLSDDGSRLFFNSYVPLVPSDTNGAMDVYEWETPGAGTCTEESHAFPAVNGGCLYLISSGESSFESEFWDASPDGANVFFNTESSLLRRDPGSVDLYDARVEGGFPEGEEEVECEGEACQTPPLAPQDPTPSSTSYRGPGNEKAANPRPCPKGKRKVRRGGKTRCVRPHKGKHQKAKSHRRAGR